MLRLFTFVVILVIGLIPNISAQEIPVPTKAKLVSDVTKLRPGESFSIGVLFDIDPGWHIYWKNPGDAGLPTKIDFLVPPGYEMGEINWPPPETYQNSEGGTEYGYSKSVLLWTNVEVPKASEISSEIDIIAETSWLSCKEICIPGKASLKHSLRISEKRESSNNNLFPKR